MKRHILFLAAVATFTWCSNSYASITNGWWYTGDETSLYCNVSSWSGGMLSMSGTQYGSSATMVGGVQTTSESDPTLTLSSAVNNDTGGAWIAYQVNVIMSIPFSFVTPGPTVGTPNPSGAVDNPPIDDWMVSMVVAPSLQVSGPYAGMYEGTLDYSSGTPVGIGDELDYLFSIQFSGATSYTFTEQVIPTITEVPEPGALALAGIGGLLFALRLRWKRA